MRYFAYSQNEADGSSRFLIADEIEVIDGRVTLKQALYGGERANKFIQQLKDGNEIEQVELDSAFHYLDELGIDAEQAKKTGIGEIVRAVLYYLMKRNSPYRV